MKKKKCYPNGGDGLFFFHKKTGHPALQISHTDKTWSNRRYTHHPNRMSDYELDVVLSTEDNPVYLTKKIFTDSIYTRGNPYNVKKQKSVEITTLIADRRTIKFRFYNDIIGELAPARLFKHNIRCLTIKK